MKLTVKVCFVLRVGPTKTQNQDPNHSWTQFNATNPIAVSELVNELRLKIAFFEVSVIISVCMNF